MTQERRDFLVLESSWEVCNKVGGIHTVLRSKAPHMTEHYGAEQYVLIGPYISGQFEGEFEETEAPEQYRATFEYMASEHGTSCHYGSWLAGSDAPVILLDFSSQFGQIDDIKQQMWQKYGVDGLTAPHDFDEALLWSVLVGRFTQHLSENIDTKIVYHGHEWLAGGAILHLKATQSNVSTVFTTHATILGRTIAGTGGDLYKYLAKIDPEEESKRLGMHDKYSLEHAAANNCDTLTTVSEITAAEVEAFLKRKPDILLPNGLNLEKFPTFEDISIEHARQRDIIREFLLYYFFPYYTFDPRETLFYFTAARYEFRNKGMDMFVHALKRMNDRLKQSNSDKTIVAFVWVPMNTSGPDQDLVTRKQLFLDVKKTMEEYQKEITNNIIYSSFKGEELNSKSILRDEVSKTLKKDFARMKRSGNPSISAFDLVDQNDPTLMALRDSGHTNAPDDPVKVILYPVYLNGADGLLNLNYYDALQASHLGVFPSYYEPWGYTPLETAALGVSAVTTDLAGFGKFIKQSKSKSATHPGIDVISRFETSYEESTEQLANSMLTYAQYDHKDRVANKIEAKRLSKLADWRVLVHNYFDAHKAALQKR